MSGQDSQSGAGGCFAFLLSMVAVAFIFWAIDRRAGDLGNSLNAMNASVADLRNTVEHLK